ncbi:MAG: rane protein, partial [Candidatus Solibacter sp.]|nr:rane protein [Candidatus Solibacter sp.]
WVHSYVADNRTYCVYVAPDEDAVRRHSELSGLPSGLPIRSTGRDERESVEVDDAGDVGIRSVPVCGRGASRAGGASGVDEAAVSVAMH